MWHDSQPVAGDHQRHVPIIPKMRMCVMRWKMMNIHPNKNHCPKAEVVQEHRLEEAAQPAEGPVMMKR